jgi:hypothetical protein
VISEYLDQIARALAFDPALSRRVRSEIEDHLREAAAADPGPDAERRAVARFGDPRDVAARFAVASAGKRARRAGVAAVLVVAAVFAAMKARVAWYGLMQSAVPEGFEALSRIVIAVDRYAFWLAGLAAVVGWRYIDSRSVPAAFNAEYRSRLRRFSVLAFAAAAALAVSVTSDALLTSLRMVGAGESLWLPVLSIAVEIACAGALVSRLRNVARIATASPISTNEI